jgi:hypothetical protein
LTPAGAATTAAGSTASRAAHRAADQTGAVDETLVLPAFVTGKKPAEPKPPEPRQQPGDALPPSERGMLIFVAALLGVGTLAVVIVLGMGGFSKPKTPVSHPTTVASAAATTDPSPTPSPVVSSIAPVPPPPPPTPTPKRSSSPAPRTLGTLTATDPAAYCTYQKAGRPRYKPDDHTWACVGGHNLVVPFAPADVCKWRFLKPNAIATVGDPANPATWKCLG